MCRPLPRLVVGLAAALLTAGLVGAPAIAYAEPTSEPTTGASPAASPSATESAPTEPPSTPTPGETASPDPSTGESSDDASPETDTAPQVRSNSDAIAEPDPAPSEAAAQQEVEAAQIEPSITLTKSASPTRVSEVGQVVNYRFAARNDGGIELTNVRIDDDLEGLSGLSCDRSAPATLAPGDTLTCTATLTITQADLDFGDFDNFASVFGNVVGDDSAEPDTVGANAAAHVTVDQNPAIALRASVSPTGTVDAGDRLRYSATATNTGNVTLNAARIASSLDSLDLDCEPSARATLAPGASLTCAGSYRVSNADARRGRVSNELTARASGPYDDQRVSDDVTLRTKVTKPPSSSTETGGVDAGLADTGGPDGTAPVGLLGAALLVAGGALVRRGLR